MQAGDWIEVIPAYGRDYTTAKAAKAAWKSNEDWQITTTRQYVSRQEALNAGLKVILRYSKLEKVTQA